MTTPSIPPVSANQELILENSSTNAASTGVLSKMKRVVWDIFCYFSQLFLDSVNYCIRWIIPEQIQEQIEEQEQAAAQREVKLEEATELHNKLTHVIADDEEIRSNMKEITEMKQDIINIMNEHAKKEPMSIIAEETEEKEAEAQIQAELREAAELQQQLGTVITAHKEIRSNMEEIMRRIIIEDEYILSPVVEQKTEDNDDTLTEGSDDCGSCLIEPHWSTRHPDSLSAMNGSTESEAQNSN